MEIDRKSGDFDTFRRWLIVEEVTMPTREITLEAAQYEDPALQLGSTSKIKLNLLYSTVLLPKQLNKLSYRKCAAERAMVVDQFREQQGEIITAQVKKLIVKISR